MDILHTTQRGLSTGHLNTYPSCPCSYQMTLTPETIASHCDTLHIFPHMRLLGLNLQKVYLPLQKFFTPLWRASYHFCAYALAWAEFAKSLPAGTTQASHVWKIGQRTHHSKTCLLLGLAQSFFFYLVWLLTCPQLLCLLYCVLSLCPALHHVAVFS